MGTNRELFADVVGVAKYVDFLRADPECCWGGLMCRSEGSLGARPASASASAPALTAFELRTR